MSKRKIVNMCWKERLVICVEKKDCKYVSDMLTKLYNLYLFKKKHSEHLFTFSVYLPTFILRTLHKVNIKSINIFHLPQNATHWISGRNDIAQRSLC